VLIRPWIQFGLGTFVLVCADPLYAQQTAPSQKAVAVAAVAASTTALQSGNADQVREALEMLAAGSGGEAAANAVVARLRRGLPPQLIEQAIDTLVLLNRPSAGPALLELTQHRRTQVRIKAISAIAALQIRSAQSALLYALDDPSGEVRSGAVNALTRVGNARALSALLTAAERGVPGAWQASAQLVQPKDLKQLFERARTADVVDVRAALDTLLARPNLPSESKLRTVAWVRERGTASARSCLLDWLAALPVNAQPNMRSALLKAVSDLDREHPEHKTHDVAESNDAGKPKAMLTTPASTGHVAQAREVTR
jgi:HEAT repeat protein